MSDACYHLEIMFTSLEFLRQIMF